MTESGEPFVHLYLSKVVMGADEIVLLLRMILFCITQTSPKSRRYVQLNELGY